MPRKNRDSVFAAGADDAPNLLDSLGQRHETRQLAVGGQPVAFVRLLFLLARKQGRARQNRPQRRKERIAFRGGAGGSLLKGSAHRIEFHYRLMPTLPSVNLAHAFALPWRSIPARSRGQEPTTRNYMEGRLKALFHISLWHRLSTAPASDAHRLSISVGKEKSRMSLFSLFFSTVHAFIERHRQPG